MGWATNYIKRLQAGETIQFRPIGTSMSGRIECGQLVTVSPITNATHIKPGNIVLCKVNGNEYLHLVQAIRGSELFKIGNNHGKTNGWTHRTHIYGILSKVTE